jgi:hypothetical protein
MLHAGLAKFQTTSNEFSRKKKKLARKPPRPIQVGGFANTQPMMNIVTSAKGNIPQFIV